MEGRNRPAPGDRDQKERQVELDLFNERREGSNWLENREM